MKVCSNYFKILIVILLISVIIYLSRRLRERFIVIGKCNVEKDCDKVPQPIQLLVNTNNAKNTNNTATINIDTWTSLDTILSFNDTSHELYFPETIQGVRFEYESNSISVKDSSGNALGPQITNSKFLLVDVKIDSYSFGNLSVLILGKISETSGLLTLSSHIFNHFFY